jgi:hypothetical protein
MRGGIAIAVAISSSSSLPLSTKTESGFFPREQKRIEMILNRQTIYSTRTSV